MNDDFTLTPGGRRRLQGDLTITGQMRLDESLRYIDTKMWRGVNFNN